MNWAKGRSTGGRAGSFKGVLNYVLHDKDAFTDERVGEVEMLNLGCEELDRAWKEMENTIQAVAAIKARAGVAQTGRKTARPVYAIAISWHPDDRPDTAHMMQTTRGVIDLLGLTQHQAMIVEHTDRPHKHVHIVVNLVHPETGKTANLRNDELKLDRWAHNYELARATIRSFHRAAKFERTLTMDRQKGVSKDAFGKAGSLKGIQLKEALEVKRSGLSGKHQVAAAARETQKEAAWKEYKQKKRAIVEKYRPVLDEISRRKPKTPALELSPPGIGRRPLWKGVAKAMLATNMVEQREPINRVFTRALSKITAARSQPVSNLAQKFRQIREGVEVMLPIRNSPAAKRYAEANRERRTADVKLARNVELAKLSANFEIKKLELSSAFVKQRAEERAERLQLKAEANRSWADFRKEHGLPDRQTEWEAKRQENRRAFEKAAKSPEKAEQKEEQKEEPAKVAQVEQAGTFRQKSAFEIGADTPDPAAWSAEQIRKGWEAAIELEKENERGR